MISLWPWIQQSRFKVLTARNTDTLGVQRSGLIVARVEGGFLLLFPLQVWHGAHGVTGVQCVRIDRQRSGNHVDHHSESAFTPRFTQNPDKFVGMKRRSEMGPCLTLDLKKWCYSAEVQAAVGVAYEARKVMVVRRWTGVGEIARGSISAHFKIIISVMGNNTLLFWGNYSSGNFLKRIINILDDFDYFISFFSFPFIYFMIYPFFPTPAPKSDLPRPAVRRKEK